MHAPGADHKVIFGGRDKGAGEALKVVRPDGSGGALHFSGESGAHGKEVQDLQQVTLPALCKADALADGRVIARGIRCGRVEHDKGRNFLLLTRLAVPQAAR